MDKLSSQISSEVDLKAHIELYPELYENLAIDALEERLEMLSYACYINIGCDVDECDCDSDCGTDCTGYCDLDCVGDNICGFFYCSEDSDDCQTDS